jgi:hypothetical protein
VDQLCVDPVLVCKELRSHQQLVTCRVPIVAGYQISLSEPISFRAITIIARYRGGDGAVPIFRRVEDRLQAKLPF